jgi:hypothetical protein
MATTQSEGSNVVMHELRTARDVLCLDGFPAEDLMEVLGEHAKEGYLSREQLRTAVRHVARLSGGGDARVRLAQICGDSLFEATSIATGNQSDTPEGLIAYAPFAIGLSMLCTSSVADKVRTRDQYSVSHITFL